MASRWSMYIANTTRLLRENTHKVVTMSGADPPDRSPKELYSFRSKADLAQYITGCDSDIGGTSTCSLEMAKDGSHAMFHGNMSLAVRESLKKTIRGGYAGFRSRKRQSLFGILTDNLSDHDFLLLRVRVGGDVRTRNSYFVNIQPDGPVTTDLYQHRLYFSKMNGEWEDVHIPLEHFVLTNSGEVVGTHIEMYRERISTIGISILGGKTNIEGRYELGLESIQAVNRQDLSTPIKTNNSLEGTQWEKPPV